MKIELTITDHHYTVVTPAKGNKLSAAKSDQGRYTEKGAGVMAIDIRRDLDENRSAVNKTQK